MKNTAKSRLTAINRPGKIINESTTDPESGVFHKGEHKKCLAYASQTGCDKNGYVLDAVIVPGNVHDSISFDPFMKG